MNGFGGRGAFSDGKYNITNDFGGTLHEYIGREKAIKLMEYVEQNHLSHGGEAQLSIPQPVLLSKNCVCKTNLHILEASVRHLAQI